MKKQGKRITALTVSAMLMLNMAATAVPVSAEGESKVYTHDGYTVEYTVKNEWTGNQNIEVTITNTGDDVLSGWAMGYNAFGEIGGLWNAKVYGHQGTEYILSSAGYNDELAPGQSTNFGYTLTGDKFKIPQNIVNCAERVDITEGYNVYYNITADFVDTYQAEMIIENTSDTDISAWQLSFDGNVTINDLWNGKLIENSNGSFKVKNSENNSVIAAGSSVSFNFGGTKNTESEPNLGYSEPVKTLPPVPVVTDEFSEAETAAESAETDAANPENDPAETEIPSETVMPEITTVTEPVVMPVSEVVFSNYKLTGMVIPMEFDFEIDPEVDSDNDGLPDYLEKELGTDRYNADTDGDGLPDGYEYFTLGTDPKKADSDDNGISDADEDFDEDGLTNLEEYEYETSPWFEDTDGDMLSDYDELLIHGTNPCKVDTDNDGIWDKDEFEIGLDPLNPITDGITPDGERKIYQTYVENIQTPGCAITEITLDMNATNYLERTTTIESTMNVDYMTSNVVGLVGEPFEIKTTSKFDTATISFKINPTLLGNTEFENLLFLWYDEDNDVFVELDTIHDVENMLVSTVVPHFSKYMIVDKLTWQAARKYDDFAFLRKRVVLAIDGTKEFNKVDNITSPNSLRAQIVEKYLSVALNEYDEANIAYLYHYNLVFENFTNDYRMLNGIFNNAKSNIRGCTAHSNDNTRLLESTLTQFGESDQDKQNIIILIGYGGINISERCKELIDNYNVKVYTISRTFRWGVLYNNKSKFFISVI